MKQVGISISRRFLYEGILYFVCNYNHERDRDRIFSLEINIINYHISLVEGCENGGLFTTDND